MEPKEGTPDAAWDSKLRERTSDAREVGRGWHGWHGWVGGGVVAVAVAVAVAVLAL